MARAPRHTRILLDGLAFPEGPRWHDGRLWFSDMHGQRVIALDMTGAAETIVAVPTQPSGLGWLPDGRLLLVSMVDRRLLRLDPAGLSEVAELAPLATNYCNDMVVDPQGRAYVGNFGATAGGGTAPPTAALVLVEPDGRIRVAADALRFPNGTIITPDGRHLVVAETHAARLSAFDVAADGTLSNRRVWATLDGAVPDGICLDAEGAIWVASPISAEVLRVREGGAIIDRVPVETQAFACMLGGPERRHLFVCTAPSPDPERCRRTMSGRIEVVEVDVPGAGLP